MKTKLSRILLLSFTLKIFSTTCCFSSIQHDEIQTIPAKKTKIIEYIESGARAAMRDDFDQAKDHYYRAIYYLTDAVERDSEDRSQVFDLSGTVELKCNKKENGQTRCYYTDEWPLKIRAAVVASNTAEIVSHLEHHSFLEAQYYEQAGNLGHNFAMAQVWYKTAAEKYFALNQFQRALECITAAGEVSKRYFPERDSYVCLLFPIIELNIKWGKAISKDNMPLAFSFFRNSAELYQYEHHYYQEKTQARKKEKKEKRRFVVISSSIIDQIELEESQRKQEEKLKQKNHSLKKLASDSKPTSNTVKKGTNLSRLSSQKLKELGSSPTKVAYISELPPVSSDAPKSTRSSIK